MYAERFCNNEGRCGRCGRCGFSTDRLRNSLYAVCGHFGASLQDTFASDCHSLLQTVEDTLSTALTTVFGATRMLSYLRVLLQNYRTWTTKVNSLVYYAPLCILGLSSGLSVCLWSYDHDSLQTAYGKWQQMNWWDFEVKGQGRSKVKWSLLDAFFTYLQSAWTYVIETYHSYSLPGSHDIDDSLKVMDSKVKVTDSFTISVDSLPSWQSSCVTLAYL